jgi:NAD(P)-dependent dehydrogenase (short-subunit alcohol dehydrogenase family)
MNVLITGSSGGFGRLITETLAGEGHTVYASMRGVAGRNEKAAGELRALQKRGKIHVVELDVSSQDSADAAVKGILDQGGSIDVVVNNAGLGSIGLDEVFTAEQMHAVFDVNVFGVQRVNRAVLPSMRARGSGLLLHISSGLGRYTMPCLGVYGASKFALEALAETYRYELVATGVDSVIVQPGPFGTDFTAKSLQPSDSARFDGYGEGTKIMDRMNAAFADTFSGPSAPNPQLVADAVLLLIETPVGQRPLRTVVDPMLGQATETVNRAASRIQARSFAAIGMTDLLQIAPK